MKKKLLAIFLSVLWINLATATDLFFSEYAEGSSNNKYLEIYNGTGATVDLGNYVVRDQYNGNPWSGVYTFPDGATLDSGDVFVIASADANAAILAVADDSLAYGNPYYTTAFNGNDVRALCKIVGSDTTIIDLIGWYDIVADTTYDPGAGWAVAGVADATKDHTLVRKSSITQGNTDWNASAGTDSDNSEWVVYDQDYFSDLGHRFAYPVTFTVRDSSGEYSDIKIKGAFNGWTSVAMYDDGTNGDVTASDSVWTAVLYMDAGTYEWGVTGDRSFVNDGWLIQGDNRSVTVASDGTVTGDTSYGIPVPAEEFDVTFTITDSTGSYLDIELKGEFTGWSLVQLYDDGTNGDVTAGDSVWTAVIPVAAGSYEWGAIENDGSEWGIWLIVGSNRVLTVNEDGTYTGADYGIPAPAAVTYSVTFTINIDPDFKFYDNPDEVIDSVEVKGGFNSWALVPAYDDGTNGDTTASDGVWTCVIDDVAPGTWEWGAIENDGSEWGIWLPDYADPSGNRAFTLAEDGTITGDISFSLEPAEETVTANVYFTVDLAAYEDMGLFSVVRNDSVQIRGGAINNWSSNALPDGSNMKMTRIPETTVYELNVPVTYFPDDTDKYKYYIKLSEESQAHFDTINSFFYADMGYENPPSQGAADRTYIFAGDPSNDQIIGLEYYNGLPFDGIIPEDHTVSLTHSVDMRQPIKDMLFTPATDTLWLIYHDHWAFFLSGYWTAENYRHDDLILNDAGSDGDAAAGDSIYTVTFDITGKTPYYMMYTYQFDGANTLEEGGGFDYGRYRVRYIHPSGTTGNLTYPTSWTFPQDTWTEDPPLTVEDPPSVVLGLDNDRLVPDGFVLHQNYPNPFNPVTEIKFTLPEAAEVNFTVYNILGQVVVNYERDFNAPGTYGLRWNGRNDAGSLMPSGVYFYEIKTDKHRAFKKMTLLK